MVLYYVDTVCRPAQPEPTAPYPYLKTQRILYIEGKFIAQSIERRSTPR